MIATNNKSHSMTIKGPTFLKFNTVFSLLSVFFPNLKARTSTGAAVNSAKLDFELKLYPEILSCYILWYTLHRTRQQMSFMKVITKKQI